MPDPVLAARVFLVSSGAVFLVVFAIPLVVDPLRWARAFRWRLPEGGSEMTVYLGRSTGALALTIVVFALPAIGDPRAHRAVFELVAWACGLVGLVHVWGAIRRTQPWTEDAEIVMYAAVCGVATWLWFALG